MKHHPYPEYKNGESHWMGPIPKHWDTVALKRKFRLVSGSTPKSGIAEYWEGDVLWITPGDFALAVNGRISTSARQITREGLISCGTSLVPADSIIVTTRAPIGAIVQAEKELCTNQGCKTLVADASDMNGRFVFYLLKASEEQLNALGLGTTFMELSKDALGYYKATIPTLSEQEQIVTFLDNKTAQIDALITTKKELIKKLAEQRFAVITQSVTRGLNAFAPICDSGVIWLGKVPEHWKIMRFSYRTRVQEGQVDPTMEPYSDMLLIAPNHIESNTGRVSGITSAHDQGAISGKYLVAKNDIIYSKIRPHLNKCALATFDGLCSADMYPIRPESDLLAEFLFYWMLAQPFVDYATESSMRVAMPKLNRETLGAAPLVVPPITEQERIVEFLRESTQAIDQLVDKVTIAVERLTEYRTALITAATTGKIDVRNIKLGN